jgi:hypothetical protein
VSQNSSFFKIFKIFSANEKRPELHSILFSVSSLFYFRCLIVLFLTRNLPSPHVSQACLDSVSKATIVQARRVEAGDVSAAGGLLSLSSSVGGTGVSNSTVSMSSESAFVPDASGAVTVRGGVALQGFIATHVHITEA